jgi:hypothetical protein
MSASAPRETGLRNPAAKFVKWKGGDEQGWFEYYDKEILDPKLRNVKIDLSEGFIVLDRDLFSVTGFDDNDNSNIISNEVREVSDRLVIKKYKDKKGVVIHTGSYEELKDIVKDSRYMGYTKSVYAMFKGEIIHLSLGGSCLKSWFEIENNSSSNNGLIKHVSTEFGKRGNVKYKYPVFEVARKATDKEWEQAVKIDAEILQPYLNSYFERNKSGVPSTHEDSSAKAFDIENWREFVIPKTGTKLKDINFDALREISDRLAEEGEFESDLFNCVSQGMIEWNKASKGWKDKANKDGKKLSEFTLDEINDVLTKVPTSSKHYIYLACAKEEIEKSSAKVVETEVVDEDEDIPF